MVYYVVTYSGPFGFIKPWSAVRDGLTYSQQFLSPSTLEGIEKKLFPELLGSKGIEKIVRYKLSYSDISVQQEKVQTRGWEKKTKEKCFVRGLSILNRGVLLYPVLKLAFKCEEDARRASTQHLCLCRNEDVLMPSAEIEQMEESDFNALKGFELRFGKEDETAFMVGYNRYDNLSPSYGSLEIDGNAVFDIQ
ncbi:hypothetical protein HQ39_06510 [Porphyromonas sp. COT-108 OH2963]|uniref:hypothetical protein n=1 Tax=Porphyromonas sp. COT-108 OH2963 TaxID=1515614 RepID=UPI00052D6A02|nr:hypothetical protein [Porphyromonas sp. COT-108 OH2963]KGN95159.1 hypothetical protein HQ39_06510 [Porphyromonas sp. COT-108 OH2963]